MPAPSYHSTVDGESIDFVQTNNLDDAETKQERDWESTRVRSGKNPSTDNNIHLVEDHGKAVTQDSSHPKITSNSELLFESKKKKRKEASTSNHNSHTVTFTVNVAMAIPTDTDEPPTRPVQKSVIETLQSSSRISPRNSNRSGKLPSDSTLTRSYSNTADEDIQPDVNEMLKKKKRVFEAPRAQNYYHIEYRLIPSDEELTKTDLVTYGIAAKIYMERHDAKVIKTWVDGEITWVSWSNSHTLKVTKDVLLQMFGHRLEVRVWDTKDKVSTRARFDRPKAFRLPQAKPGEEADEIGGVKVSVMKQLNNFIKLQPKKAISVRPLPSLITYPRDSMLKKREAHTRDTPDQLDNRDANQQESGSQRDANSPTPQVLRAVQNKNVDSQDVRTFSRLGQLAGAERPSISPSKDSKLSRTHSSKKSTKSSVGRSPAHKNNSYSMPGESDNSINMPKESKKKMKEAAAAYTAEQSKRHHGICSVSIPMSMLFAGLKSLTGRLENPTEGIEDLFVTINLDGPLMSDKHKQELNPMIIKLNSATNLPASPMTFQELGFKCHPVYCKYKFHKEPEHLTRGKDHEANIYWDDINVVLLGTMEPSELREYLNGPGMEVEVHDRDRKEEEVQLKPTLFGDDLEDEKISNVGTVASRRTLHDPFSGRDQPWDPYGVAKLDLSELLLGHRLLYVKIPIHNCLIPDVLGQDGKQDGKLIGISGAVDGPVDQPLLAGHYFNSNSTLKVMVEVSYPLITHAQLSAKEDFESTAECPFGRIVFLFDYKNVELLHKLQNMISSINAHALELDDMPEHVINAALSTYKLSVEQQFDGDLDIVTGFQVLDGSMHLYILEGLRDKAIHLLWEALPQPENKDVRVLFNSNLSFSKRLYGPLDVDLCRIKLHEPLSVITEQSLLYVRDMVPKPCFQALVKLKELSTMKTMKDAVRNDIFPTAEMIVSMSREFGVPLTAEDFEELREDSNKLPELSAEKLVSRPHTSRAWTPIDNFNQAFLKRIIDRQSKTEVQNYIKDNIDDVQLRSTRNRLVREKTKPATVQVDMQPVFNYSIQKLNSSELAKEKLRLMLAEHPDTRYTYCQNYHHSMTVVPVNTDNLRKQEQEDMMNRWRTENGFIYPGMRNMQQSNIHPKCPDEARKEELTHPWKENILHVNILQSPLDRDRFPWDYRHQDVDLYRQPQPLFGHNEPVTIHLAGEKLKQEKLKAKVEDQKIWQSKIVVEDTHHHIHRCLPETEIRQKGFYSSNMIDRLQGLLKDSPSKYSLKKPYLLLEKIPALDVVLNPSVDTEARAEGKPLLPAVKGEGIETTKGFKPGPFETRSWVLEKNKIPAIDYQHDKLMKLKGKDFNLFNANRQFLWKRAIEPLSEPERDNHLFQVSQSAKSFGSFEDSGFVSDLGQRSYTEPTFGNPSEVTLTTSSPHLKLQTQDKKILESVGS